MSVKNVGFWKACDADIMLPFPGTPVYTDVPIANTSSMDTSTLKAFVDKLTWVEKTKAETTEYLGFSTCRICGCRNGNQEYTYNGYCWPSGYMHYLKDHNVEGDAEFVEMVRLFKSN
jgi:hypothetical protein